MASIVRRSICFVAAAALFTVISVQAQSTTESSSNASLLVASDGSGGVSASATAPAMGSEYGGVVRTSDWKQYLAHNLSLELGAGFNAPIGNDTPYITWGGNLTVGGGLHLNKHISLLAEYQFLDNKLPGSFIAAVGNQNSILLDSANAHIWSFTLDPVIDLFPKRLNSVYVTGGGGFYRKVTSFNAPACCDYYGYAVDVLAGHFSSNQGGANLGFGLTHRIAGPYGDGRTTLYAEARYLFLNTPAINQTNGLGTTELIPVTFGVRW